MGEHTYWSRLPQMPPHSAILEFDPCDRLLWELKLPLNTGVSCILGKLTQVWVPDNQEAIWALLFSKLWTSNSWDTAETEPGRKINMNNILAKAKAWCYMEMSKWMLSLVLIAQVLGIKKAFNTYRINE